METEKMIDLKVTPIKPDKNVMANFEQRVKDYVLALGSMILKVAGDNLIRPDPYKQWVTGQLYKSGRVDTTFLKDFAVEVVFTAPHAVYVEFGTAPHAAPLGPSIAVQKITRGKRGGTTVASGPPDKTTNPLDWWAYRVGQTEAKNFGKYGFHTTLGFAVWIKIMRDGSDPHPYLRPAVQTVDRKKGDIAKKYGFEVK